MVNNNQKTRLYVLLIFIAIVLSISIYLTMTYKIDENDNIIKIDVANQKENYLVENNSIRISSFEVKYTEKYYYVNFIADKLIDENLELADKYNINLYDSKHNLIDTFDGIVLNNLSRGVISRCELSGKYTGINIASIELERINR